MSSMESPQPGDFMMKAVIPILRQIVSHGYDQQAPSERNPLEAILQFRNYERQQLKTSESRQWSGSTLR